MRRPRPQLADQGPAARANEAAENEGNDDRIVELPGDRNEVGNEIEWQCQVADETEQEQLAAAGDPRVACEPGHEDYAVGDEGCERAGSVPSTHQDEPDQEGGVGSYRHTNANQ